MNTLRKAINTIVTLAAFCLCLGSLPAEAALPNGSQDVYNIFTTGIGAKITGTDFDPYVKNNGAYASWSSSDFILTYDGGPVGTDSSGKGIMLEDDSYPPRGAFITYSSSSTGFDTRTHWMKVSANNTTLGSFQLTDLLVTGFGDTYQINVIGTKVGGGTVQTGWVSYYVTDWNTVPTTTITLTNFAGVQLTSYEIDILPVDNGAGGRPASFTFKSFTVSNAHVPVSPPTVASISPTSGSTAGGTSVTITGTDLSDANSVTIGGAAATGISVLGSTSITATTPAGTAGAKDVVVKTTYGGSGTGTGLFTYLAAPAVTTGAASAISTTDATLNGTVNANGNSTAVTFEYGLTTGYGSSVAATPSPVGGASSTAVSASISGLACGTTYHFRIKGTSGGGTAYGSDQTFASSVCPSYTVTYNGNGNTGGAVPTDATSYHTADTATTLGNTGALLKTGYTFAGWNTAANGSGTSRSPGSTFAIGSSNVTLYAQWAANNYTVTYNGNGNTGGSVPTDGNTYNITHIVTVLGNTGTLTKTGYTFAGWNTAANGSGSGYSGGATFAIGAVNVVLYAQWTQNVYTVSYNGNGNTGGTAPTDATSYHTADTATALGNTGTLLKTGYTFAGWNTAANGSGTSYAGGDTFAIGSSHVTLYAQWTANDYTVTYNGNGNSGGAAPSDATVYHITDTVTVLGNTGALVRTGYTFAGWNTAADGSGTSRSPGGSFAIGSSHITLYAQWIGTVSYDGNGNSGGSTPTDATAYLPGATVTAAANSGSLTKTGYTFSGWNSAADGSGTSYAAGSGTFSMSGNLTLYARWTLGVSYHGNGSTGGSVPADATGYLPGATVTVLGNTGVLSRTGFSFAGWNTAANGSGTTYAPADTFAIGASTVLYARWTGSVTYHGNGHTGGSVPSDASSPYLAGAIVTALGNTGSLSRTGYVFAGWNTAADGSGTSHAAGSGTFSMAGNIILYARWTPTYSVSYDGNGNTGGSAPGDAGSPYASGASVTVKTVGTLVKSGYTFSGWNTAANGSGTAYAAGATFSIAANTTLYAQWALITYAVTYDGNGHSGGAVPSDASSPYVANAVVTVKPAGTLMKSGYTFSGWNTAANGSGTAYAAGATFSIAANTTLYAQWALITYAVTYDGNGHSGGAVPSDASSPYVANAVVTVKPAGTLVKSGYTFSGWNTAANGSGTPYAAAATFNIGGNTTLYAQWTVIYTGPWNQSISFDPAPSLVVKGSGAVGARASSGLPVSLASSTPGICSLSGNTVNGFAAGTCTITANQSGDGNYNAAPQVTLNIAVGKGSQTITFGAAPALTVGGKTTVTASASSGLPLSFSSRTTGVCTVSGNEIAGVAVGTCTIAADQPGNADYNAAPQLAQNIAVGKGSQTITFGATPTLSVGARATFTATVNSGLPLGFSSRTPGVCTVSGTQVTGVAVGTCTIAADQPGNADYNAAPQAALNIAVGKGSQTIAFGVTPTLTVGAKATLTAIASSGLPVSFSSKSAEVCAVAGTQVSSVTAGTCTIAADQPGNADYNAAPQLVLDIVIDRIGSETKLTATPASPGLAGQSTSFKVQVSGAVGTPKGSVVFKDAGTTLGTINLDSTGSGSYSGNLDIGLHELTASYAGDAVYLASQGSLSYRVAKTIDSLLSIKTDPNPSRPGNRVTVSVGVTPERDVGSLSGTVTVSVDDGQSCKIALPKLPADLDCVLSFNSKGVRQLSAKYSGNGFYSAATASMLHYVGLDKPASLSPVYMLLLD